MKKAFMQQFLRAALCAGTVSIAACGGGSDSPVPTSPDPAAPAVASVSVAPSSATDWWGYDIALTATARDANNTAITPRPLLSWTSSADAVATVSNAGLVTLNRQGTASITAATAAGVRGSATMTARGFAALGSTDLDTQCVISDDRLQILCWGSAGVSSQPLIPNARALANYEQPTPISRGAIPANARIKQVSISYFHACALTEAGQAYCWGDGLWGKLGSGNENDTTAPVAVVQGQIPAGVTLTSIETAPHSTCATASNGRIFCWGDGIRLPVSGLPASNSAQTQPLLADLGQIPAGANMVAVAPGINGGLALGDNGRVYHWNGGTGNLPTPVAQGQVPTNVRLVELSTDDLFACALGDDGHAYCWGSGFGRRFGVGDDTFRSNATPLLVAQGAVPAGVRLVSLTVGGISNANCALGDDSHVYCWGSGYQGSLGNGVLTDNLALTPIQVLNGERPAGVRYLRAACGRHHCTALGDDGRAYTWGFNQGSALARPIGVTAVAQPTLVSRPNRD